MDIQKELDRIQSLLFDQISSAVSNRDLTKIAKLSGHAKECEKLRIEHTASIRRVEAFKNSLNGSESLATTSPNSTDSAEAAILSPKAVGARMRNEWLEGLRTKSIFLDGHGKQYQTERGQSVAVAFANELPELENQWFLGLADEEPTAATVLLCKSRGGKLHDIVLPVSHLGEVWPALNRSGKQVKFHVQERGAGQFFLRIPKASGLDIIWLDITKYIGNYDPLR